MLILSPLDLSSGAWTLVLVGEAPTILQVPISLDLPAAELGSSLADLYWQTVEMRWSEPEPDSPPTKYLEAVLSAIIGVDVDRTGTNCC